MRVVKKKSSEESPASADLSRFGEEITPIQEKASQLLIKLEEDGSSSLITDWRRYQLLTGQVEDTFNKFKCAYTSFLRDPKIAKEQIDRLLKANGKKSLKNVEQLTRAISNNFKEEYIKQNAEINRRAEIVTSLIVNGKCPKAISSVYLDGLTAEDKERYWKNHQQSEACRERRVRIKEDFNSCWCYEEFKCSPEDEDTDSFDGEESFLDNMKTANKSPKNIAQEKIQKKISHQMMINAEQTAVEYKNLDGLEKIVNHLKLNCLKNPAWKERTINKPFEGACNLSSLFKKSWLLHQKSSELLSKMVEKGRSSNFSEWNEYRKSIGEVVEMREKINNVAAYFLFNPKITREEILEILEANGKKPNSFTNALEFFRSMQLKFYEEALKQENELDRKRDVFKNLILTGNYPEDLHIDISSLDLDEKEKEQFHQAYKERNVKNSTGEDSNVPKVARSSDMSHYAKEIVLYQQKAHELLLEVEKLQLGQSNSTNPMKLLQEMEKATEILADNYEALLQDPISWTEEFRDLRENFHKEIVLTKVFHQKIDWLRKTIIEKRSENIAIPDKQEKEEFTRKETEAIVEKLLDLLNQEDDSMENILKEQQAEKTNLEEISSKEQAGKELSKYFDLTRYDREMTVLHEKASEQLAKLEQDDSPLSEWEKYVGLITEILDMETKYTKAFEYIYGSDNFTPEEFTEFLGLNGKETENSNREQMAVEIGVKFSEKSYNQTIELNRKSQIVKRLVLAGKAPYVVASQIVHKFSGEEQEQYYNMLTERVLKKSKGEDEQDGKNWTGGVFALRRYVEESDSRPKTDEMLAELEEKGASSTVSEWSEYYTLTREAFDFHMEHKKIFDDNEASIPIAKKCLKFMKATGRGFSKFSAELHEFLHIMEKFYEKACEEVKESEKKYRIVMALVKDGRCPKKVISDNFHMLSKEEQEEVLKNNPDLVLKKEEDLKSDISMEQDTKDNNSEDQLEVEISLFERIWIDFWLWLSLLTTMLLLLTSLWLRWFF